MWSVDAVQAVETLRLRSGQAGIEKGVSVGESWREVVVGGPAFAEASTFATLRREKKLRRASKALRLRLW